MKPTIFITGATGKTGFFAAKKLLEKGYPVKGMARKESATTKELKALGAEIVHADFLNLESMKKALKGVDRAYFVYPPEGGLLKATAIFILAAQANGLKAIVNMSQLPARQDHNSALTSEHWLGERMLDLSGIVV